jgi:hypothetical protein
VQFLTLVIKKLAGATAPAVNGSSDNMLNLGDFRTPEQGFIGVKMFMF